jgi:metal-responsive CopG/Arc/MetJ family transcriptional regulator
MQKAKTVCITLPPELLKKAQKVALREHRTMSELFREALRRYMAAAVGVTTEHVNNEQQVEERGLNVLHSFRMEKPPRG